MANLNITILNSTKLAQEIAPVTFSIYSVLFSMARQGLLMIGDWNLRRLSTMRPARKSAIAIVTQIRSGLRFQKE